MEKSVNAEIARELDEAERRGACLVPRSKNDQDRFDRRVATGELVMPVRRLYARTSFWNSLKPPEKTLHLMRALQELHPGWVFCGTSAAVAYGLSVGYDLQAPIEVASFGGSGTVCSGAVRKRHVNVAACNVASGVVVTTAARTVFDCARRLSFRDAVAVADSALRLGFLTKEGLVDFVGHRDKYYRGAGQAKFVASFADGRAANGGESIARAAMWELGFAMPDLQVPQVDPMDPTRHYFVDFCWRLPDGSRVLGELDGGEKYEDPEMTQGHGPLWAMRRERLRESRITVGRDAGVVRFSLEQVADAAYFDKLLTAFGIPKERRPLVKPSGGRVLADPCREVVPLEAYGLL